MQDPLAPLTDDQAKHFSALAAQYDLGNAPEPTTESKDPVPGEPVPPAPAQHASLAATSSAPKDPVTGRFVKATSDHPPEWVEMAKDFLDPQDIEAVPVGQLPFVVRQLQRQERKLRAVEGQRQAAAADLTRHEDQRHQPDPLALDWGTTEDEAGKLRPASPQDYGTMGPMIDAIHRRLAALERHTATREKQRETSEADDFFAKDAERYGDGRADEIDRASDAFARRSAIIREAMAHKDWTGSLAARLAKADRILFGATPPVPKPKPKAEEEEPHITPQQEEWLAAGLQRPTQRGEVLLPQGRKAAERKVAEILSERARQNGPGTSLDEFPE